MPSSPRVIKLLQAVREHVLLLVLLQEGVAFPQAVILVQHAFEELMLATSSWEP